MGRSQETFGKKDVRNRKEKKRKEKEQKRAKKKSEGKKNTSRIREVKNKRAA